MKNFKNFENFLSFRLEWSIFSPIRSSLRRIIKFIYDWSSNLEVVIVFFSLDSLERFCTTYERYV